MELWSADSEMEAEILGWVSMAQLTARLTVNQEVGVRPRPGWQYIAQILSLSFFSVSRAPVA